jgi:hypothetical protein
MTEAQRKFVELEKQKEIIKSYLENLNSAVSEVAKEIGINGFFQDTDGTVYKIVVPTGKWVPHESVSYLRTRRMHEEKSPLPLALKDAEAAGFAVAKK